MYPDQVSNPGPLTYESGNHNHESSVDNAVLDCNQLPEEDLQPIFREEFGIKVEHRQSGSLSELTIQQQDLFKLARRPSRMF